MEMRLYNSLRIKTHKNVKINAILVIHIGNILDRI